MFSNQVELDPKLYLFNPEFEFKNIRTCKLIAIPTTAGTGSEVTQFATIWDDVAKRKHSLLSSHMYPDLAILDPELLEQLPFDLALYSCLDATAHCMETLWNKNRTSESESLAKSGLQIIDKNLFAFSKRIWNKEIAGQLQIAAVFGGLAISISRTAISHSISYPLTSRLSVPHGLAVGFTLAAIYESLDGDEIEFDEGRRLLESVVRQLKEIDLSQHIMRYASITQILDLVDEMSASDRAKNFVKSIDRQLLISILEKSLHS
jgi:alcohol dehydrogenase